MDIRKSSNFSNVATPSLSYGDDLKQMFRSEDPHVALLQILKSLKESDARELLELMKTDPRFPAELIEQLAEDRF